MLIRWERVKGLMLIRWERVKGLMLIRSTERPVGICVSELQKIYNIINQ